MEYLLYITKNNINGKVYAGKHIGTREDSYIGSGPTHFLRAVRKYGKENFTRRWLRLKIPSEEQLNNLEIRLIRLLKHYWKSNCYNIHRGGTGGYLCKYMSPEERLEVNRRITEGKLKQYQNGPTIYQILGRVKQKQTLKHRHTYDPVLRSKMIQRQITKGKTLSDRIKSHGLTENEQRRNKLHREHGNFKLIYNIIYPSGIITQYTDNHVNFLKKHNLEDTVFTTLHKTGKFTIKRRTVNTNHMFPVGTVFELIEKIT